MHLFAKKWSSIFFVDRVVFLMSYRHGWRVSRRSYWTPEPIWTCSCFSRVSSHTDLKSVAHNTLSMPPFTYLRLANAPLYRCILSSGVPAIWQVLVAVPDKPGAEEYGACCGHAVLRGGHCGYSPLLGINCHTSGLNLVPWAACTYTNKCHRYSGRFCWPLLTRMF